MAIIEIKDPGRRGVNVGERFLIEWGYSNLFLSGGLRPPSVVGLFTKELNSLQCITAEDTEVIASVAFNGFIPVALQKVRTTVVIGCRTAKQMSLTKSFQPVYDNRGRYWTAKKFFLLTSGESSDVEQIMNSNPSEFPAIEVAQSSAREAVERTGGAVAQTGGAILEGVEQIAGNPLATVALVGAIVVGVIVLTRG